MATATGEAHLRTSLHTEHEVETLERRLRARGPEAWLGISTDRAPRGMRRYATDLRLGTPSRGALSVIHKSAYVDLGPVAMDERATLTVEISWRSANLAPLFPVFSGWLTVRPGEIAIEGRYVPPGGPLGFVADRALMHRAARWTADWVLRELDGAPPRPALSHGSDAEPFKPDPSALT
jgi:hypothetical protein